MIKKPTPQKNQTPNQAQDRPNPSAPQKPQLDETQIPDVVNDPRAVR